MLTMFRRCLCCCLRCAFAVVLAITILHILPLFGMIILALRSFAHLLNNYGLFKFQTKSIMIFT
jgi:hypothetical protein